MNKKILALAAVILAFPAVVTAESVYKWTDENGVTHFGDRKPMGKESESVSVRTGKKTGSSPVSPQEKVAELEKQRAEAEQNKNVSAVELARQKQRAANCETAKTNLTLLRTGSRVKVVEKGEERYLTPEEIEQKKAEFESIAAENCGSSE